MWPVSLMESQIFNSVLQLLHAQTIRYPLLILREGVDYFLNVYHYVWRWTKHWSSSTWTAPWTTHVDYAAEV